MGQESQERQESQESQELETWVSLKMMETLKAKTVTGP